MSSLFMLLGHKLLRLGLSFVVQYQLGVAAPFLDGMQHLPTPPDIHDVLRLAAVGLDTRWILE